jgi:hypothetical protein
MTTTLATVDFCTAVAMMQRTGEDFFLAPRAEGEAFLHYPPVQERQLPTEMP